MKTDYFFHEDDYCQVEITPIENLANLEQQADEVFGFAGEHASAFGFTGMMAREDHKFKLEDKKIRVAEMSDILLKAGFVELPKVFTGSYTSNNKELHNTKAFKTEPGVLLFDFKDDMIENIWLNLYWQSELKNHQALIQAFTTIAHQWDLLLMDWNQLKLVNLKDEMALQKYLEKKD